MSPLALQDPEGPYKGPLQAAPLVEVPSPGGLGGLWAPSCASLAPPLPGTCDEGGETRAEDMAQPPSSGLHWRRASRYCTDTMVHPRLSGAELGARVLGFSGNVDGS